MADFDSTPVKIVNLCWTISSFSTSGNTHIDCPTTYEFDTYLYTFDNGGKDSSETLCKNNHLEKGANRNVFLGNTQNVTLSADCHDNIFFRNCENCVFDYGTYGNFFQDNVVRCKGTVHEK